MVGTQRSRVWWVHRAAENGGYTEEQGMVGTQRSRVWRVHRGAGYGGYTAMLHRTSSNNDTSWSDNTSRSLHIHVYSQCTNLITDIDISTLLQ